MCIWRIWGAGTTSVELDLGQDRYPSEASRASGTDKHTLLGRALVATCGDGHKRVARFVCPLIPFLHVRDTQLESRFILQQEPSKVCKV